MAILTKAQILAANDVKRIKLEVPEWGGEVYISTMTGTARDEFETGILSNAKGGKVGNARARLAAATITDEAGNLLFTADDIDALGLKSQLALDRVVSESQKLNKLTNADLEEAEKN